MELRSRLNRLYKQSNLLCRFIMRNMCQVFKRSYLVRLDTQPMIPHRDSQSKANLRLVTERFNHWDNGMSDDSSQLSSASSSPVESESPDAANDEILRLPEKQEPDPTRGGDPCWVARPRNAFIIFRCEYARRHARMSRGTKRGAGPASEKSLSKRAAEAWHQLPNNEKSHFKARAEKERSEHARLHPDYRFRPMKRIFPNHSPHLQRASLPASSKQHSGGSDGGRPKGSMTRNISRSAPVEDVAAQTCSAKACGLYYYEAAYNPSHLPASHEAQLTTSSSYSLAHRAMKPFLPPTDFDACGSVDPCLESVLPRLPQHTSNPGPCQLQHPRPFSAASSASWLADCGGDVIDGCCILHPMGDDWSSSIRQIPRELEDEALSKGVRDTGGVWQDYTSSRLSLAPSYSTTYVDPYIAHPEYFCGDLMGDCHTIVVGPSGAICHTF